MKQKIRYGFFNLGVWVSTIILWVIFITVLVLCLVFTNHESDRVFFWIFIGIFVLIACWSLFVIPFSVSADDENVMVHKLWNTKSYKIKEIKSIKPTQVGRSDLKKHIGLLKWPKYYSGGDGEYYQFYGSPNNPVLITLKNGDRVIIGSSDQKELLEHINSRMDN